MNAVKFAASLLLLAAFALTACNTPATRRDLYAPAKASGPYNEWYRHGGKWPRSDAETKPGPSPVGDAAPAQ
jgi:hypothetical protein